MTGATALSRVEAEYRKEQGRVPIPRLNLEDSHVLGKVRNQERAMKILVQVRNSCDSFIFFYNSVSNQRSGLRCELTPFGRCGKQTFPCSSGVIKIHFNSRLKRNSLDRAVYKQTNKQNFIQKNGNNAAHFPTSSKNKLPVPGNRIYHRVTHRSSKPSLCC